MFLTKVKKLSDTAVIPSYTREGDAAFDLVSNEYHLIQPQATVGVGTGLAFEIPTGFEIEVVPRSGISLNTPLRVANTPGTIDENYRGELKVILNNSMQQFADLYNDDGKVLMKNREVPFVFDLKGNKVSIDDVRKETGASFDGEVISLPTIYIRKGDRIAQGKLREVFIATFEEVDTLSETNRGENGFGSSGVSTK